jgi:hypothetical protein
MVVNQLSEVLKESWLWIIVAALITIMVLPLAVVWFILNLPPPLAFAATIILIISWGIVAGYKDWIMSKRKEKQQ